MSFRECIVKAADADIINNAKQDELLKNYDANFKKLKDANFSDDIAAKQAGLDTFDELKFKAAQKTRKAVQDYKIKKQFEFDYKKFFEENTKEKSAALFLHNKVFGEELPEGVTRATNVETRINTIKMQLDAGYVEILQKFRHNLLGTNRNKATMQSMGKEIFEPGSTGNKAAEELAKAWSETAERARKLFNAAGGNIPKMNRNYLPQNHNSAVIYSGGDKLWKNFLLENDILDVENMINYRTGKVFSPQELEFALTDVFNSIVTHGHSKDKAIQQGSSYASRRMDHRFLHFKSFEAWEAYTNKFGDGNVFDVMVGHIQSMSRDIALMEILGTNPKKMLDWMTNYDEGMIYKNQKLSDKDRAKLLSKNKRSKRILTDALNYYNGTLNDPENIGFAKFFGGMRNLTSSMYLGAASFMAVGDFFLTGLTSSFNKMPITKSIASSMKMFSQGFRQGDSEIVKTAMTSGMIAEAYSSVASGMARMSISDTHSPEITRRIAHFVLGTTGLSWLTQAGRWGAGLETMAFMGRHTQFTFNELKTKNTGLYELLRKNRVTGTDWDLIRSTEKFTMENGAEFLRPIDILKREDFSEEILQNAFHKMGAVILDVQDFSVPVAKAKPTVLVQRSNTAGTATGEIIKNAMQFKQFPATLHLTHIRRALGRKNGVGKIKYIVPLVFGTTMMGTLAFQLKELTKGKDPTNPLDLDTNQQFKFWSNMMLHGGGLGVVGDMLFSGRYGGYQGSAASIAGSVPNLLYDLTIDPLIMQPLKNLQGGSINPGGILSDLLKKNFPGGSMWYLRLALERHVFDTFQEFIDPKYQQKRNRLNTRIRKDGTGKFFWKPGDKKPSRAPQY